MKVLVASLLVLLCAMTLYALEEEERSHTPATCCLSYISRPIPRKVVVRYYETSGLCTKRAIIFVTKKNRHICSNPNDAWVQHYIKELQMNP